MYGFKKLRGFKKTRNKCAELYFSSHNIAMWLGVDLGRTANTPAASDGPKVHAKVDVRAFYRKFKIEGF